MNTADNSTYFEVSPMGHSAHPWVGQSAHMVFDAKSYITYIIYTNIHRSYNCDRVLIVPSRWRHCYNDDTVFFNYFTFIYSFVLLGHELYYIMLLLVSYCIFPAQ